MQISRSKSKQCYWRAAATRYDMHEQKEHLATLCGLGKHRPTSEICWASSWIESLGPLHLCYERTAPVRKPCRFAPRKHNVCLSKCRRHIAARGVWDSARSTSPYPCRNMFFTSYVASDCKPWAEIDFGIFIVEFGGIFWKQAKRSHRRLLFIPLLRGDLFDIIFYLFLFLHCPRSSNRSEERATNTQDIEWSGQCYWIVLATGETLVRLCNHFRVIPVKWVARHQQC